MYLSRARSHEAHCKRIMQLKKGVLLWLFVQQFLSPGTGNVFHGSQLASTDCSPTSDHSFRRPWSLFSCPLGLSYCFFYPQPCPTICHQICGCRLSGPKKLPRSVRPDTPPRTSPLLGLYFHHYHYISTHAYSFPGPGGHHALVG
jgi:hypothetical protein